MEKNKITRLPSKNTNVLEFLDRLKEKVETDNIETLMVAAYGKKDGEYVITGYIGLDYVEKQELVSHIQIDIIDQFIKANYVTPE